VDVILSIEEEAEEKVGADGTERALYNLQVERQSDSCDTSAFRCRSNLARKRGIVEITTMLATPKLDSICKQPGTRPGHDKMITCLHVVQDIIESLEIRPIEREDAQLGQNPPNIE